MSTNKHNNNELLSISSIIGDSFFIPSYQRGYRWTRSQVEDLLEDIHDFLCNKCIDDFYCLQPLVVRSVGNDNSVQYRIVDGQQRLTTIWLIMLCLNKKTPFKLEYERPACLDQIEKYCLNGDYCEDISNHKKWNQYVERKWDKFELAKKNVELFHLFAAKLFILNWFNAKQQFPSDFTDSLRFIWHTVEKDRELDTFKNLNSGKIPLTNSELIKAIFLGSYGSVNTEGKLRQSLLAEEFDAVERRLREDDFWAFLNSTPKPTSCIGFIFELMQTLSGNNRHNEDKYRTYFYFKDKVGEADTSNRISKATEEWNRCMQIFHCFEGWYANPEIHNLIGYLRAIGREITPIFKQYETAGTKTEFLDYLKLECMRSIGWNQEIDNSFLMSFRYDSNKNPTNRLLLLINIAMLGNQKTGEQNKIKDITKFSFKDYHNCNWHIEHISPNNAAYASSMSSFIDEPFPKVGDKLKESLNSEQKKNADPFIAVNEDSIMSLPNLTLLSSHINESIGRKLFTEKRSVVIKKQTEGYYVPPCTMMVFTKSFTSAEKINEENKENKFDFWSDIDRKEYLKSIEEILTDYFGQKPKGKEESENYTSSQTYNSPCFIDFQYNQTPSIQEYKQSKSLPIMTYSKLIDAYDFIVIPKIQRDYAQGRSKNEDARAEDVRTNILNDIFSNRLDHKIDFQIVFGTVEERHSSTGDSLMTFIPIDGQQRLTTLFLLSLYRNKRWNEENSPKFIYETRRAATEFCYAVTINKWIGFPSSKPSEAIINSVWFMDYWQQDPTVDSMLRMLDVIHTRVKVEKLDYPNIDNIVFSFFDLGKHNISENIYLKMNSRGKPLTSFENIKAEIEKKIVHLPENWKRDIDTIWIDSFWAKSKPTRLPDNGILRFIANFLFIKLCEKGGFSEDIYKDKIEIFWKISELSSDQYVSSEIFVEAFNEIGLDDLSALLSLKSTCAWNTLIEPAWRWSDNDGEWRSVLDGSYTKRAVMYAIMLNSANSNDLHYWVRFAWNMARNTVDDFKSFCSCCRLFEELTKRQQQTHTEQHNIGLMELLSMDSDVRLLSDSDQYKEELVKASVYGNEVLFKIITELEGYAFFEGAIRPLFHTGENGPWFNFEEKVSNIKVLVPKSVSERAIMCDLIAYIPDNKICQVFCKDYLSFNDTNLRSFFLRKENRTYIEHYLLKDEQVHTKLATQLIQIAQGFINDGVIDYYIRTDWEKDLLLTNASKRNGWKYRLTSFVLNDDLYIHITDILLNGFSNITFRWDNRFDDSIRGIEIGFTYEHYCFCYFAQNNTIGLMHSNWSKFLGHKSKEFYTRILTQEDTHESLKEMLESMIAQALNLRNDYIEKIKNIFHNHNISYTCYGCNGDADVPIANACVYYRWITIAFYSPKTRMLYAATVSSDLEIEIGLRKVPEDITKNEYIQKESPDLGSIYSDKNAWWYKVCSFPGLTEDAIQELNKVLLIAKSLSSE